MFRHECTVEIRFVDIDAFGHVNNAHHLSYVEHARVKYFNDLIGWDWNWNSDGIILAKAEVKYLRPILFSDRLHIQTRCARIGGKSMELEYLLLKYEQGQPVMLAEASTVVVAYDYTSKTTQQVPDVWKKAIIDYEEPGSVKTTG
ncbi:MAG: hypothetical protein RL021_319 [Bacteroidota bacterium]